MTIYNVVKTDNDVGDDLNEGTIVATFTDKVVATAFVNEMNKLSEGSDYSVEVDSISNGFYKVTDIEWDVDSDEELECLPSVVNIPDCELNLNKDLSDAIGDWLSSIYGYCHKGFRYYYSGINGEQMKGV